MGGLYLALNLCSDGGRACLRARLLRLPGWRGPFPVSEVGRFPQTINRGGASQIGAGF